MTSLASVLRRHVNHYRGEILSLQRKEQVARTMGDAVLALRLEQQIHRARIAAAALDEAHRDWMRTNAQEARRQISQPNDAA